MLGSVTVGEEQLLWDEAVAQCASVDGCVIKVSYIAECIARLTRGSIVGDFVTDRFIQHGTTDLAWTTDGDAIFGNRKHASCECVAEGHWSSFSACH